MKKTQSNSPVSSEHKTLFGKLRILGNKYFFATIVTVWVIPTRKSLILDDKLRSVYVLGNFNSKSKMLFIFFFLIVLYRNSYLEYISCE